MAVLALTCNRFVRRGGQGLRARLRNLEADGPLLHFWFRHSALGGTVTVTPLPSSGTVAGTQAQTPRCDDDRQLRACSNTERALLTLGIPPPTLQTLPSSSFFKSSPEDMCITDFREKHCGERETLVRCLPHAPRPRVKPTNNPSVDTPADRAPQPGLDLRFFTHTRLQQALLKVESSQHKKDKTFHFFSF
ncbi:hypothetical protein HJG60_012141 [Phyllostomus discolor]|uniref:Uncharacterized protein n=1 Tax=Phyllostomus discolor TaxID=89673 RepID=A0A833ZMA2_9CHIR|nr:hypothetical protein HJG60_012141 [Phyllostomus discolor]